MERAISLSESVLSPLRLHVERKGDLDVDDTTREPYRELARAGLMVADHGFTRGREAFYRLTDAGYDFACGLKAS